MIKKPVIKFIAYILLSLGVSMLLTSLWSLFYNEPDFYAFIESAAITIITSIILILFSRGSSKDELNLRDGFYVVTIAWFLMGIFSSLPYYQSGYFLSFADSFFESMSGLTTTGASILSNPESLPHAILFWRSFTQFIGGMGIILFTIAILPILGVGGVQLFRAEVPGPTADKLTPRVRETAKYLWYIYIGLIFFETLILYLEGIFLGIENMTFFNAICHSLTTMSTGGFSTFNTSIAGFDSMLVTWTIIIFMVLAATNFSLHFLLISKKSFEYFKDSEYKFYLSAIILFTIITFINLSTFSKNFDGSDSPFTASIFNTVAIMTTTGFTLFDYETWPSTSQSIIFFLFFLGGMSGSTSGGIKIIRTILVFKYIKGEVSRMLHPRGLHNIKIGENVISNDIVRNTMGFYLFYILIFSVCTLIFSATTLSNGESIDFLSALSISASSIGNIGPGLGVIGPMQNWSLLNDFSKYLATFCMLLGRLEIFTVIILFSRTYWKS